MVLVGCALACSIPAGPAAAANVITVTSTSETGFGSLREAITSANLTPEPDTIRIQTAGTIELRSALPDLRADLTIEGPGSGELIVRRASTAGNFRIFHVTAGATVTMRGLGVAFGQADVIGGDPGQGGGIWNEGSLELVDVAVTENTAAEGGGGIKNDGSLELLDVVVADNTCSSFGGGIATDAPVVARRLTVARNEGNGRGGGIYSRSRLALDESRIEDNSVVGGGAGVFAEFSEAQIVNTTVSGNNPDGIVAEAPLVLIGSTVSGQRGTSLPAISVKNTMRRSFITGSTVAANAGTGIEGGSGVTMEIESSIVAGNGGEELDNSASNMVSRGRNLWSDFSGPDAPQASDQRGTDPQLGPLADNGGPTRTHALPLTSPAVDRGVAAGALRDQRGVPRTQDFPGVPNGSGDATDVGAFELRDDAPPETAIDTGPRGLTSARTPAFGFSSNEPGAAFECRLFDPGGATPAFGPCSGPGASHSQTGALADGDWAFEVRAGDAAGNVDPTPAAAAFTVDASPPAVGLAEPASGATLTDPAPRLAGTAGIAPGDSDTVVVRIFDAGGRLMETVLTRPTAAGAWAARGGTLADGAYTAVAEQADAAGNAGRSAANSFSVDVPEPVLTPALPSAPSLAGAAAAPEPAFGESTRVTLSRRDVRATRSGYIRMRLENRNRFMVTGVATMHARRPRGSAARRDRRIAIGAIAFKAPARRTIVLKRRLSRVRLGVLRRARRLGLEVEVAVSDPRGTARSVERRLTLSAPRR